MSIPATKLKERFGDSRKRRPNKLETKPSRLHRTLTDIFSLPGIADTFDFKANLEGYFLNDTDNNPHGILPELPDAKWSEPHGREAMGALTVWQDGALVAFDDVAAIDHER